jgi:hypothetical protein
MPINNPSRRSLVWGNSIVPFAVEFGPLEMIACLSDAKLWQGASGVSAELKRSRVPRCCPSFAAPIVAAPRLSDSFG